MHGFISESTSKISDGFWSAAKLLLLFLLLTMFPTFLVNEDSTQLRIAYLVLLMAGGVFFLFRSLVDRIPETQNAMNGMVSGLFFWQAVNFSGFPEDWVLFQPAGYLLWLGSVILIYLLWSRVLPVGMRFMLLVIMLHWIGRLLITSLSMLVTNGMAGWIVPGSIRLSGIVGILFCLWFIVVRSSVPLQRRYAAVGLYFSVLISLLML